MLRLRDGCGRHPGRARGTGWRLTGLTGLDAFVPGPRTEREPTGSGPLDGLRFAVKDLIDVAGTVTGGGTPDWAAGRAPAAADAPCVAALRAAGARLCGKTVTDELAFSLEGRNAHYGTPRNPRAPGRLPGGSSSGSASAVAAGVVDFALGTDTGGSVRVPAAFCGLFGFRPTHGAISLSGVVPFAPSYDTVGLLAREPAVLARAATVLLPPAPRVPPPRFLLAEDAFELADPGVAAALRDSVPPPWREARAVTIFGGAPDAWRDAYRALQGREIWQVLGPWVTRTSPRLAPAIAERFADAAAITEAEAARWRPFRAGTRQALLELLGPDDVLMLPSAPSIAPLLDAGPGETGAFYGRALALTAVAGHAGLPAVSLPVAAVGGAPVGLCLVGRPGSDGLLLDLAARLPAFAP